MWEALKDLMKEEIEEEMKKTQEKTTKNNINSLMNNLKLTAEQAMSALDIPAQEWETYKINL